MVPLPEHRGLMDLRSLRIFLLEFLQVTAVVAALIPIIILGITSVVGAAHLIYILWQGTKYHWIAIFSTIGLIELAILYLWGALRKSRD